MSAQLSLSCLVPDHDGGSHFENLDVSGKLREFAPPAKPFSVSEFSAAKECGFLHLPAGWHGEMHPAPIRMWIYVLHGELEFEASNGDKRNIRPGSALLLENASGRGHVSKVLGAGDVALAVVRLPSSPA